MTMKILAIMLAVAMTFNVVLATVTADVACTRCDDPECTGIQVSAGYYNDNDVAALIENGTIPLNTAHLWFRGTYNYNASEPPINKLYNVSSLAQLTELRELDIYLYEIIDGDAAFLTNLTKLADLGFTYSRGISRRQIKRAVENLPNLDPYAIRLPEHIRVVMENANMISAQLEALIEVGEIPLDVTFLSLYNNRLSDLSALSQLTELEYLNLNNNQIVGLAPLNGLTELTALLLQNNEITNITPLSSLKKLYDLNLYNNEISDLSPLSEMSELIWLYASGNKISNLAPLSVLTQLRFLYLANNQISDISPLSTLTNLDGRRNVEPHYNAQWGLDLDGNQISDITPLSTLTNLTRLSLSNNQIRNLTTLYPLKNLIDLGLRDNPIVLSQIDELQLELLFCTIEQNATDDILCPICGLIESDPLCTCKCEICGVPGCNVSNHSFCPKCGVEDCDGVACAELPCIKCGEVECDGLCSVSPGQGCNDCDLCSLIADSVGTVNIKGRILGGDVPTIFDVLEVLKNIVGMDNAIDKCGNSLSAALLVADRPVPNKPTIFDVLEILKYLVGMDSAVNA